MKRQLVFLAIVGLVIIASVIGIGLWHPTQQSPFRWFFGPELSEKRGFSYYDVREVIERHRADLEGLPGYNRVGIQETEDGFYRIRIRFDSQESIDALVKERRMPTSLDGVPVGIEEDVGPLELPADILVTNTRGLLQGYDWETGKLVFELDAGPSAIHSILNLVLSDDGRYIYVASATSNSLLVIDARTNSVGGRVVFDGEPQGVALIPHLNKMYVANLTQNRIEVLDLSSFDVINRAELQGSPYQVLRSVDGRLIYTSTYPGRFVAIRTEDDRVIGDLDLGGTDWYNMVLSPDGSQAYVAGRLVGKVSIVNLQGFYVERTIRNIVERPFPNGTLDGLSVSLDGKLLFVSDAQSDYVAVINIAEGRVVKRIRVDRGPGDLDISANGEYLFTLQFGGVPIDDRNLPDLPGSINVINTRTMEVEKKIAIMTGGQSMVLNSTPDH